MLATGLAVIAGMGLDRWFAYQKEAEAQRVERALARRVSLHELAGAGQPLKEVLRELQKKCDVPIFYSPRQFERTGMTLDRPVDVPDAELPLETALRVILRQRNLAALPIRGRILLTTMIDANSRRYGQVHPLPVGGPEGTFGADPAAWNAVASRVIELNSTEESDTATSLAMQINSRRIARAWLLSGRRTATMNPDIEQIPGALLVVQSRENQQRIAAVLAQLNAAAQRTSPAADGISSSGRSPAEVRIDAALNKPVDVDFDNVLLSETLAQLAREHKIPIFLHFTWLADNGVPGGLRVTLSARGMTLRSVLGELTRQHELGFFVEDELIQVTSMGECRSHRRVAVHEVAGLLQRAGTGPDKLLDILTTNIGRDRLEIVIPGADLIFVPPAWLVVVENEENQQRVDRLLARLRTGLEPGRGGQLIADAPLTRADQRLAHALNEEVTLVCQNRSLESVCEDLSKRLGICIPLQRGLKDDVRKGHFRSITVNYPPLPLRSVLALLQLETSARLTYKIENESLILREWDNSLNGPEPIVADLDEILVGATDEERQQEREQFRTLLDAYISRYDQHVPFGGSSSPSLFGRLLVVDEKSRPVRELLEVLAALRQSPPAANGESAPIWVGLSKADEAIIRKLQQPVTPHAESLPLKFALQNLAEQQQVPLFFDNSRLSTRLNGLEDPVSLPAEKMTLQRGLEKLMENRQLGIVVRDSVLIVTTAERSETHHLLRLYSSAALKAKVAPAEEDATPSELQVRPAVLDNNKSYGGPAIVLPIPNSNLQAVSQTLAGHLRLEKYLTENAAPSEGPRSSPQGDPHGVP